MLFRSCYNDTSVFKEDVLYDIKTKKEELETLCLTLQVLISDNAISIKSQQKIELVNIINNVLDDIYKENITEEESNKKIIEINNLCNDINLKMSGINLDRVNVINSNAHILESNDNGTSIDDLLLQRQNEEIEQIIIDSINN